MKTARKLNIAASVIFIPAIFLIGRESLLLLLGVILFFWANNMQVEARRIIKSTNNGQTYQ